MRYNISPYYISHYNISRQYVSITEDKYSKLVNYHGDNILVNIFDTFDRVRYQC